MTEEFEKGDDSEDKLERDHKKGFKKGPKEKNRAGLPSGIFFKILRMLFIWMPLSIILLLIIALVAMELYLTPSRVEGLIVSNFNEISYGEIALKVRDFSPYSGFVIEDVMIKNGNDFNRMKLLEIKRLVVRYKFFSLLIGDILFEEIGIYKPRIYLEEKNGVWNVARLMKPGRKDPEKEEKEIEKDEEKGKGVPLPDEINLPISIKFLFRYILDDLRIYVKGSNYKSSVKGLSFNVDIFVPPVKRIPLSIKAISLLRRMKLQLNPKGKMDVSFYSKDAELRPPLIVTWNLIFNKKGKGMSGFSSNLKLGTYKTAVRFKGIHLAPLNFMISYDIFYNPLSDYLILNHLGVEFFGKKWLNFSGDIRKVRTDQKINIQMTESEIVLYDLYPYFLKLTGERETIFRGTVSLFPLTIKGDPGNIDIDGVVDLRGVFFKNSSTEASLPALKLSYSVKKSCNDMDIRSALRIPHLRYTLDRDKSGDNALEMNVAISSYENFKRVNINKFLFRFYNPVMKKNALLIALKGNLLLNPDISGKIRITKFSFLKEPLIGMVPPGIGKSLVSVPLKEPVNMNLDIDFAVGDEIKADLAMFVIIPDFNVMDLKITADVVYNGPGKMVNLNAFNIESPLKGLLISAGGMVDITSPPFSDSDLKLILKMVSPEMKAIYGPWQVSGLIQLNTKMEGDLKSGSLLGSIDIERLYVMNRESKIFVDDLNMHFPFKYNFIPHKGGESRIQIEKSHVIDNYNFRDKDNFTIRSVRAKHPARDITFEYMKDFAATMFFRNNTFEITKLKAYILDGSLYGRNILFNLADLVSKGKKGNVEYNLILDITNIDIGKLDNPDPKHKTRDAELSLNANFVGKGIDLNRELTMKGFINIHKIGEKFANRLLKGLSEEKGKSKLGIAQMAVDNSVNIDMFNFNLDMGLIYTSVSFNRRALGFLVAVEDVEFERMPIQEYLRNILGRR